MTQQQKSKGKTLQIRSTLFPTNQRSNIHNDPENDDYDDDDDA